MKMPVVLHMEHSQEWTSCDDQLQLFHMYQAPEVLDGLEQTFLQSNRLVCQKCILYSVYVLCSVAVINAQRITTDLAFQECP